MLNYRRNTNSSIFSFKNDKYQYFITLGKSLKNASYIILLNLKAILFRIVVDMHINIILKPINALLCNINIRQFQIMCYV